MAEDVKEGGSGGRSALAARPDAGGLDIRAVAVAFGPRLAGWALPFLLVVYLGLKGGGYDPVVHGEVGIVAWWLVVLGALAAVLPTSRIGAAGWLFLGLLGAFAAWTALGIGWSSSSEQSVASLGLVLTYLGVLALALATQGTDQLRRTAGAVAAGIAFLGILALVSFLHPSWFPRNETVQFIGDSRSRLNYPLNYWNGLAALVAIGIPLLLTAAVQARLLALRALAAAAVPALVLTAFYTYSRGGALEIAIGLAVLVALHPRRLSLLPTLAVSATGSAILVAAATQRDALENGLASSAARSQGNEMLALVLVVCAGAALLQVAIALAGRHRLGPRPSVSRRSAALATALAALAALAVFFASGGPGFVSDRWHDFKNPTGASAANAQRFDSSSGTGRYQWWRAALDENATSPLIGTGPGTFQYWWSQHATFPAFVRNAHSLYLESLGELGIIGMLLIVAFVLFPLGIGVAAATRAGPELRTLLAGAVASGAAFATAAGIDWVWQIPVLPVTFTLIAAALVVAASRRSASGPVRRGIAPRVAAAVAGAVAIALVAIPLAGTKDVRASQAAVREHDLGAALSDAQNAASVQPYAASPRIQEALVLELQGRIDTAIAAAKEATQAESTNWRTWMILSRLQAERGDTQAAVAAYERARSLNPKSPLFPQ